jgi:membrane-anchored protein YejM (alkaline phosphatase superfamily)
MLSKKRNIFDSFFVVFFVSWLNYQLKTIIFMNSFLIKIQLIFKNWAVSKKFLNEKMNMEDRKNLQLNIFSWSFLKKSENIKLEFLVSIELISLMVLCLGGLGKSRVCIKQKRSINDRENIVNQDLSRS